MGGRLCLISSLIALPCLKGINDSMPYNRFASRHTGHTISQRSLVLSRYCAPIATEWYSQLIANSGTPLLWADFRCNLGYGVELYSFFSSSILRAPTGQLGRGVFARGGLTP